MQSNEIGAHPNQSRTSLRQAINAAEQALCSFFSGPDEPVLKYPFMVWWQTGVQPPFIQWRRTPDNDDWIRIGSWDGETFFVEGTHDPIDVGVIRPTLRNLSPSSGWLWLNGWSVGNPYSGANIASDDIYDLFAFLHSQFTDSILPLYGGQTNQVRARNTLTYDWETSPGYFKLPDWRGRFPLGTDTMGREAIGNFPNYNYPGMSGGAKQVTINGINLTRITVGGDVPIIQGAGGPDVITVYAPGPVSAQYFNSTFNLAPFFTTCNWEIKYQQV